MAHRLGQWSSHAYTSIFQQNECTFDKYTFSVTLERASPDRTRDICAAHSLNLPPTHSHTHWLLVGFTIYMIFFALVLSKICRQENIKLCTNLYVCTHIHTQTHHPLRCSACICVCVCVYFCKPDWLCMCVCTIQAHILQEKQNHRIADAAGQSLSLSPASRWMVGRGRRSDGEICKQESGQEHGQALLSSGQTNELV